jgi:hypothetical protein
MTTPQEANSTRGLPLNPEIAISIAADHYYFD